MSEPKALDLVLLLPGKDEKEVVEALLARHQSLRIRPLRFRTIVHPRRDPGCFWEAPDTLASFQDRAKHALVLFDHEGSGQEERPPDEVEEDLVQRLGDAGWGARAAVVVLRPELESWVWSPSPHVDAVLGWKGRNPPLRGWLEGRGFLEPGAAKPLRPKEAMEAALREVRIPRSSSLYGQLAEKVGLQRCADESFRRFGSVLVSWFRMAEAGR